MIIIIIILIKKNLFLHTLYFSRMASDMMCRDDYRWMVKQKKKITLKRGYQCVKEMACVWIYCMKQLLFIWRMGYGVLGG